MLVACLLLLVGCGQAAATEAEQELVGGATPDGVVTDFWAQMNATLASPDLSDPASRRAMADRLAAYFAPAERLQQREVLGVMLAQFADSRAILPPDVELTIEVVSGEPTVEAQSSSTALVRLPASELTYRRVRVSEGGFRTILYEETYTLSEVLRSDVPNTDGAFPVVRVNDRWFLSTNVTPS